MLYLIRYFSEYATFLNMCSTLPNINIFSHFKRFYVIYLSSPFWVCVSQFLTSSVVMEERKINEKNIFEVKASFPFSIYVSVCHVISNSFFSSFNSIYYFCSLQNKEDERCRIPPTSSTMDDDDVDIQYKQTVNFTQNVNKYLELTSSFIFVYKVWGIQTKKFNTSNFSLIDHKKNVDHIQ